MLKKKKEISVVSSLIKIFILIITIVTMGVTGIFLWTYNVNVKGQMEKDGLALTNSFQLAMQYLLTDEDNIPAAQKYVEGMIKSNGVGYALIIDDQNKAVVSSDQKEIGTVIDDANSKQAIAEQKTLTGLFKDPETGIDYLDVFIPLTLFNGKHGAVNVGVSVEEVLSGLTEAIISSVIFAVAFIIVSSLIMYFLLNRFIKKPLQSGTKLAKAIADKDLTLDIDNKYNNEIGIMINAVNFAKTQLKDIIENIQRSSREVTHSSDQMSATLLDVNRVMEVISDNTHSMANDFGQNAVLLQETYTAVASIAEGSQTVAEAAGNVLDYSHEVEASAVDGKQSIDEIIMTINDISVSTKEAHDQVDQLKNAIVKITDIVNLVNNISDQTNLLALNAAIEAARAGESGRGFAVVADEVRKLAEQSREALGNIEELTKNIKTRTDNVVSVGLKTQEKVKEGVLKADRVSVKINTIIDHIQVVTRRIEQISQNVTDQAATMQEINATMDTLNETVSSNVSSTQEISASIEEQTSSIHNIEETSEELKHMAIGLNQLVNQFKL